MLPLIPLAATYLPDLIRLIAGDKAGNVAATVSKAVSDVTNTTDPVAAQKALDADPAAAADLQAKLAQIAVDAQKAQNDEADKQRADDLEKLKQSLANTADARAAELGYVKAGSPLAWAPVWVSIIVTLGFFVILAVVILYGDQIGGSTNNTTAEQIINISIGTLATGFATVVNFWLGSSQGSRDKDQTVANAQAANATQLTTQLNRAMDTVQSMSPTRQSAPPAAPASKPDNFDRCVAATLFYEGGFVDNPNDSGGATNFGITKRTLESFLGKTVTIDDVKNLSSSVATEIYRASYWNQMLCASLPAGVDLMVFDFGVQSGPDTAIKTLQRLVGVNPDGAIGKVTLPAVAKANPQNLINDLASARLAFLRGLVTYAEFGEGWERRVPGIKEKALAMATPNAAAAGT
jgi:lysozyme family protein